MISISQLILPSYVELKLEGVDKLDVISALSKKLYSNKVIENLDGFIDAVMERERLESTGIGRGFAIPHARSKFVKKLSVAFGINRKGVDFFSLDKKPSYVIFLVASPENDKAGYITTLAKLSRLMIRENMCEILMNVKTPEEVIEIIKKNE